MIRAVVDTNILVSALITKKASPPFELYNAFISQKFLLITSPLILAEVEDVINREKIVLLHKLTPVQRLTVLEQLAQLSYITFDSKNPAKTIVKNDPKDDKFIYAALHANAEYIVSGDHHLLDIKNYNKINIVTPNEFLLKL